ncbi:MAG TPA: CRTAC1 family protein, partial [Chroococcidiopsis sp.]
DFDNDGYEEIFFNNIGQPNRLFGWRDGRWTELDIGDALEPTGLGTGAAVGDFNGDDQLELVIAHGESGPQPLSLYYPAPSAHHWLRIIPLTKQGAPARGAVVTLVAGDRHQIRAIDAGSGYLCQMEPVAHFGLGASDRVDLVEVRWLDGTSHKLTHPAVDQVIHVAYPGS